MIGRTNMRIVWVGFHQEGESAFKAIIDAGYNVVGAVTLDQENLDKRSGVSIYLEDCENLNIPLHRTSHINNSETRDWLNDLDIDLMIVLGWSQILSPEILSIPKIGTIGAHASKLPALKGSAPINWAIIKGLEATGNSLIELVENVDSGVIIDQECFEISKTDSCSTLYEKVADSNKVMLLRSLPKIEELGMITGTPQELTGQELLPRRKPSDGIINWGDSAATIYNLIRAVTRPYPGAFSFINNKKIFVWSASFSPLVQLRESFEVGTVVGYVHSNYDDACGLLVSCGCSSALVINEIEMERVFKGKELLDLGLINHRFKDKL